MCLDPAPAYQAAHLAALFLARSIQRTYCMIAHVLRLGWWWWVRMDGGGVNDEKMFWSEDRGLYSRRRQCVIAGT